MRFIGIDPGEKWVGIAMLEVRGSRWHAETRVLSVAARRNLLEVVEDVLIWAPATIIAEDYRVRPVGHQRFTQGYTLRLLGALEVTAIKLGKWITLLPGPSAELEMLQLGRFINRQDWGQHTNPNWQHALSAWRIVGRHLMAEEPKMLERLRKIKKPTRTIKNSSLAPRPRRAPEDLYSPLTLWIAP